MLHGSEIAGVNRFAFHEDQLRANKLVETVIQ